MKQKIKLFTLFILGMAVGHFLIGEMTFVRINWGYLFWGFTSASFILMIYLAKNSQKKSKEVMAITTPKAEVSVSRYCLFEKLISLYIENEPIIKNANLFSYLELIAYSKLREKRLVTTQGLKNEEIEIKINLQAKKYLEEAFGKEEIYRMNKELRSIIKNDEYYEKRVGMLIEQYNHYVSQENKI
jgi:hypothetical protein